VTDLVFRIRSTSYEIYDEWDKHNIIIIQQLRKVKSVTCFYYHVPFSWFGESSPSFVFIITSIKQSHVFKGHIFLSYHRKFNMNWTSFKVTYSLFQKSVFNGVSVTWSLVFSVVFCRSFFVLFLLVIVLSVLRLYRFWLPRWYLQTLLKRSLLNRYANTCITSNKSRNSWMKKLYL
jgi:hypothetical protein